MKKYPNVLVLGDGLLGSEIIKQTGWDYLSQEKNDIDVVERPWEIYELIDDLDPDVVLNCIAYTNTYDPDREKHWKINFEFVASLVDFCGTRDIPLVHISTDYVFDGTSTEPCNEEDAPNPMGVYGRSKLEGEERARAVLPDVCIVRTAWLYGKAGKNFVWSAMPMSRILITPKNNAKIS